MQAALVDTCCQFIAGRLDLVRGELGDRVIQVPEVAGLVLGALGSVPEDLDLVHVALGDNLALGEVVKDHVPLIVRDAALGEASEDLGALVEALDAALDDVHEFRHVEVVTVLLGDGILIAQSLHPVGADETQHPHLKGDSAGTVEGVVEGEAHPNVVAHLGQLGQLVLEIILNVDPRTIAHDVGLALEVAQTVVSECILNGLDQRLVLDEAVTLSADAQHLLGVGAAISQPSSGLTIRSQKGNGFNAVVKGINGSAHVCQFWFLVFAVSRSIDWEDVRRSLDFRQQLFDIFFGPAGYIFLKDSS